MTDLIGASAALGSIVYLVASIEYTLILRKNGAILLPALLLSAVWGLSASQFPTVDFLHAAIWSTSFLLLLHQTNQLKPLTVRWLFIWAVPTLSLVMLIYALGSNGEPNQFQFYVYLLCCIGTLLITEQLIRNSNGLVRTLVIGIGTLFLFNLYLYSSALIMGEVSVAMVQARGLANTTVGLLLCVAPLFSHSTDYTRKKIELSRPLVFTTTSLVLAGSILLVVSGLGYLLSIGGGQYSTILQPFLLFLAVLFIGYNLASPTRRSRVRIWINKNFFQTKFDHNIEWRNLSERLSPETSIDDLYETAIRAVLPIYHVETGALYLQENGSYVAKGRIGAAMQLPPIDAQTHRDCLDKMVQQNWIYFPRSEESGLARFNHLLPDSLRYMLVILPLTNRDTLLGFITLSTDSADAHDFDWEDIDLLRIVGKQVSNFIAYQMLSDEMVVTRQFEAFHQFTTFVMHDLKNLIAQQALVVENAARFIDNPEFVADAINTIENSVKRMDRLVQKITRNRAADELGALDIKPVALFEALQLAIEKCSGREPAPVLHPPTDDTTIVGDIDTLIMVFTHLITNAHEACEKTDTIDIHLRAQADRIECKIEDTGSGMTQEFVDNRLFKPFDSTKKYQGMGIGAYQCRQILSKIGGRISVSSKIGEGTCFTVILMKDFRTESTTI